MSVVTREITVDAPRDAIWRYLEDPDLLAAWLRRNDFRAEKGRAFRFRGTPSGDWDGIVSCRVVEVDPPRKLAFTWSTNTIGAETLVTIELEARGGTTHLRLVHANFADAASDVVEGHAEGWTDHLRVLGLQAAEDARGEQKAPAPIDWTAFDLHVAIDAPPERALAPWAGCRGMESFLVEVPLDLDPVRGCARGRHGDRDRETALRRPGSG